MDYVHKNLWNDFWKYMYMYSYILEFNKSKYITGADLAFE